jgi:tetratricopeptide (TPR) repeat protein
VSLDRTKVLEAAQRYLAKGQYDRAIAEYRKLVVDDPKDVRTWLKIGDLYTRKGSRKEACDTYQRVAEQYAEQGFFLKAVAVFKQILKLDPTRLDVLVRLAEMYEQLQLVSDALASYEQVAQSYVRAGDPDKALTILGRMANIDAENVPIRIKYAEALSKAGKTEAAADAFEASAQILKEQGRLEDYVKVAERMLYHRSTNLDAARDLAEYYLQRNDAKRALSKLQLCFKANPRDLATLELLANAFYMLGQTPKTVSVFREMARIHQEGGSDEERARILTRILELDPGDKEARQALAAFAPRDSAPARPHLAHPEPDSDEELLDEELLEEEDASLLEADDSGEVEEEVLVVDEDEVAASGPPSARSAPRASSSPSRRSIDPVQAVAEGSAALQMPGIPPDVAREAQVARLLTECDVFLRYGLRSKVIAQLHRVLEIDPTHIEARERLKDLHLDGGDAQAALEQLYAIVDLLEEKDPAAAKFYVHQIAELRGQLPSEPAADPSPAAPGEEPMATALTVPTVRESMPGPELTIEPALEDFPGAEELEGLPIPPAGEMDDERLLAPMSPEEFEAVPMSSPQISAPPPVANEAEPGEIEELLDEAEFFVAQGLYEEAIGSLRDALTIHAGHPLLSERLAELEAVAASVPPPALVPTDSGVQIAEELEQELGPFAAEETGSDVLDVESVFAQFKKGIEETIGLEDSDTHYDLGIAYKEMGLLDDAMHEFELCLTNKQRECMAHTMIGLCSLEKGETADAIGHFKKGLYADVKTENEELGLYFELGVAYELLRDPKEAIYYFQKVLKRAPEFRNVTDRIAALTVPGEEPPSETAGNEGGDDVDSAFDDLMGERD